MAQHPGTPLPAPRPRPLPEFFTGGALALFVLLTLWTFGHMNHVWGRGWGFWAVPYAIKTLIEVVASGYATFYVLVALSYRKPSRSPAAGSPSRRVANVVIVYLCCNDLDVEALQSIVTYASAAHLRVVVHDDSATPEAQTDIDSAVEHFRTRYRCDIDILRRAERSGGKAGALNHVVQHLPTDVAYLVLCDSDSFLLEANLLSAALPYFDDLRVALVQCRNIGYVSPGAGLGYRLLSLSVTFYDTFVHFMDRFGWSPFLGHNALLRVAAIKQVGGFTPGQLADDIDFSVKLRLCGYTICYARELVCGERHPLTYEALRRRTAKWAYGCTQVLLRWGWALLTSPRLTLRDRATFFLTVGYYHFQLLLLLYLVLCYLMLPFHDPVMGGAESLLVASGLVLLLTFIPSITYFAAEHALRDWPRVALCWGLTYGSQDLVMLRAIGRCLMHRPLAWVPTNTRSGRLGPLHLLPELCCGGAIIAVALAQSPPLLLLPTTVLFAGKFLLAPLLHRCLFERSGHRRAAGACTTASAQNFSKDIGKPFG